MCDWQLVVRVETLGYAPEMQNQTNVTQEQTHQVQESASDHGLCWSFSTSLSKISSEQARLCHAYLLQHHATRVRCPLHGPSGSDAVDYRRGFKITLRLAPKWYIQGKKGYLIITIWVVTSIQTLKQVIKVGNIETGSNKFELVQHSPSTLQELQTHPQYDVEANK